MAALLFLSPPLRGQESAPNEALQALAGEFFEWRSSQQPVNGDDIPRVERPDGWIPDFSPKALNDYRARYEAFIKAHESLDRETWNRTDHIDARILRAAIERVYWELDVLQLPSRNPLFYVDQTLGSLFELLILSSPMTEERAANIILRLDHIPRTLEHARINLDRAVRPFAAATITTLSDIDLRLETVATALRKEFPAHLQTELEKSMGRAASALNKFARWLESEMSTMRTTFAIGPYAYQWFLSHVALIPYTPDELLAQGQQAWAQSVALHTIEKNRIRDVPELPVFNSSEHQVRAAALKEGEIRAFLEKNKLMTIPDWLMHYRNRPIPAYLQPLSFMGVTDDLTSETRLDEDGVSYIPEPAEDLPYFALSSARDPRPLIIHEGIPGHYFQLARSWANPNPIRRRYIDSAANEGIAFYVEELLLAAGLFEFSPRSRETIYSFMRLRALRVEIDIRLATGDFSIEQAGAYLARAIPMDRETADAEAVFFAFNPGQAISYQVGKLQILKFLAEAKLEQGDEFSLQHFHDFLMENGNVPISLLRWEYLGRDDEILRLDVLGGKPVTVPQ
jgi:uncharacterized protein (DUF885 family)